MWALGIPSGVLRSGGKGRRIQQEPEILGKRPLRLVGVPLDGRQLRS